MQTYNDKCRFLTGPNTLWVVQNNKPVIDAVNESMSLINLRKQLLFQYLTFLPCIDEKVNILLVIVMGRVG